MNVKKSKSNTNDEPPTLNVTVHDVNDTSTPCSTGCIDNATFGGVAYQSTGSLGNGRYGVDINAYGTVTVSASNYNGTSFNAAFPQTNYDVPMTAISSSTTSSD